VKRSSALVYLHGFNSSPQGVKCTILAAALAKIPGAPPLWRPQLAHRPAQAMGTVTQWIDTRAGEPSAFTIIGSSLGGFYATWLAERYGCRAIVINPAVHPERSLAAYAGAQQNPYTGERYDLDELHFAELRALKVSRISNPDRYLLLMRSGDELLDWREAVAYYAGAWQHLVGGGDHGWEDFEGEVPTVLQFAGM